MSLNHDLKVSGYSNYELSVLILLDDGRALQSALQELTYQTTVPNIFIQQKHIGGNSELQDIKDELPQLLKGAGAL